MAKLDAKNPLTGNKLDLSIKGLVGLFLGALVLIGVWEGARNAGNAITSRVNNKYVDLKLDPLSSGESKVVDNTVFLG